MAGRGNNQTLKPDPNKIPKTRIVFGTSNRDQACNGLTKDPSSIQTILSALGFHQFMLRRFDISRSCIARGLYRRSGIHGACGTTSPCPEGKYFVGRIITGTCRNVNSIIRFHLSSDKMSIIWFSCGPMRRSSCLWTADSFSKMASPCLVIVTWTRR